MIRATWTTSILLGVAVSAVQGQVPTDAFLNQQRLLEEEVRSELNTELPADQKVELRWGGWYSFWNLLWDDGINSSRQFRQHDLRLWGSLGLDEGTHQFYVRGKFQREDFNHGDSFDGGDGDWIGPNLDRAFYEFDLARAAKAYRNETLDDWNFRFKVGRDLVEFGTGYALSLPMDHVLMTLELGDVELNALGGTGIKSNDDIDRTRPNKEYSNRNFWGAELAYTGFKKHRPFVYAFWNDDQHGEGRYVPLQSWDYDSWYLGAGSTGELWQNLRYGTELVFEHGDTYGWGDWYKRDEIHAWAYDINLEYLTQWKTKPRFLFEYMFASGDPDRRFRPTGSLGGNASGDDDAFNAFGYRDTGLSFAPRLTNVHIWRAGAAFTPFEKVEMLKNLELGTDWFLYSKNRSDGAVSDGTANRESAFLGWEMDYFASWRITSDLAWTTRFGTFFPGRAFSDQTTRTFLLTGLTWSF